MTSFDINGHCHQIISHLFEDIFALLLSDKIDMDRKKKLCAT